METQLALPSFSTSYESYETNRRAAFFNILPKDHSLCIADYEEGGAIKIGVYIKDPNTKLTLLVRDEDAYDEESLYTDFYEDKCKNCDLYFESKEESETAEDERGQTVEINRRIYSPCRAYSDGLEEVFNEDEDNQRCLAGYKKPVVGSNIDSNQVVQNGYVWTKEIVDSSPLYFEFRYHQNKYVDDVTVSIAEAYQLVAPESGDKIYFLTKHMEPFNMYSGTPPNNICYGDTQRPQSKHLNEVATAYQSSVFNDDLLKPDEYEYVQDQLVEIEREVDSLVDDTDRNYQRDVNESLIDRKLGFLFPSPERTEYVISSDFEGDKTDAVMILSLYESPDLYYRIHASGVPSINKFQGFTKPSLYKLNEYIYTNPANPSQSIHGYITECNSAGYAWFFVDRHISGQDAWRSGSFLNQNYNNIAVCFGQIKP